MKRIELYNRVWREPLPAIAKDLKCKIRDLRFACLAHKVPLPDANQAQRIEIGVSLPKPVKLPNLLKHEADLETVKIGGPRRPGAWPNGSANIMRLKAEMALDEARMSPPSLPSKTSQTKGGATGKASAAVKPKVKRRVATHILLVKSAEVLSYAEPRKGLAEAISEGCCGISVRPEDVGRAIAFMSKLFRALESRGLKLTPNGSSTRINGVGGFLDFRLRDKTNWTRRPDYNLASILSKNFGPDSIQNVLSKKVLNQEATGYLRVYVSGCPASSEYSWGDHEGTLIEDKVSQIVRGFLKYLKEEVVKKRIEKEKEYVGVSQILRRDRDRLELSRELDKAHFIDEIYADIKRMDQLKTIVDRYDKMEGGGEELEKLLEWSRWWYGLLERKLSFESVESALKNAKIFSDDGLNLTPDLKRKRTSLFKSGLLTDMDSYLGEE